MAPTSWASSSTSTCASSSPRWRSTPRSSASPASPRRPPRSERSAAGRLPAPAGLGPREEVIDAAEGVGDPVLAAVADEQHTRVVQRAAALGAAAQGVVGLARAQDVPWVPVRALDDPRHDVLEPAEDGLALARRLRRAAAGVGPRPHFAA